MIRFQDEFIFLLSFLYFPSYLSAAQGEAGQDAHTTALQGSWGGSSFPLMQSSLTHNSSLILHCSRASLAPSPRINPSSSPQNAHQMPAWQALEAFHSCTTPCPCQTWIWPIPRPAQNHPHRSLPVLSSCNDSFTQ